MESVRRVSYITSRLTLLVGRGLLLLGLSACGSPSPEAPGSGQATGSTGAVVSSPTSNRAGAGLTVQPAPKPDGLSPDALRRTSPLPNSRAPLTAFPNNPAPTDEKMIAEQAQRTARERWYAEARESPDVTVRLQALEQWARQPQTSGGGLDPVTFALVDEDESIRTRAQELWGQRFTQGTGADGAGGQSRCGTIHGGACPAALP